MENDTYIKVASMPDRIRNSSKARNSDLSSKEKKESEAILKELERFGKTTTGKRLASKEIGVSLATLYRKIRKYNIM